MNFLFDPGLNLFLQSFRSPLLTVFMLAISLFGSQPFFMLASGFIFFRVGLKRGFVFAQMLFWSFILTDFLKELLQFPRPIHVDPSILTFNEYLPNWIVESVADNPGFPSGHVCSTVVFWGSVLICFSGRFQKMIGIGLIALMPLSRMYLGRHFLGDVLGGFFLGLLILLVGFVPLKRSQHDPLFLNSRSIPVAGYFVLPLMLNAISYFPSKELGELFGFNMAIYATKGPQEESNWLTPFLLAIVIYLGLNSILSILGISVLLNRWIHFFASAIPIFFALVVSKFFK
jgi:membrane-associated phospholipid phosphatase